MSKIEIILIIILLNSSMTGFAASWFASVDSWSINRESQTVGFDMNSSISGNISAVNVAQDSRCLPGYHSSYADVNLNDVHLKDRTSALQGHIESEDQIYVRSAAIEDVKREIIKPYGSSAYTFEYEELWPVIISSNRALSYKGSEINDREFRGNNLDFVGSSSLYGTELSKVQMSYLELKRMNVTVVADDSGVTGVTFMPTKSTSYFIDTKSTGISSLKYRQTAEDQTSTRNGGDERFYGAFHLRADVQMDLTHERHESDNCWQDLCVVNETYPDTKMPRALAASDGLF